MMLSIFQSNAERIPAKLLLHAKDIATRRDSFSGLQQQKSVRNVTMLAVLVQRLDVLYRPIDDPVLCVTFDLSDQGVRLIAPEPIVSPFMSLELTTNNGEILRPTIKVLRCRRSKPYFDVAGKMVFQIDETC
ncbi:MAG: hypothetical protein ACI9G1_003414 [Pirellulaceae bacterium]|jgi:hypothetical protein